jgi:hypothetical protein
MSFGGAPHYIFGHNTLDIMISVNAYYYLKCLFRNFYGILQFTIFFMDRYCVRITVFDGTKKIFRILFSHKDKNTI